MIIGYKQSLRELAALFAQCRFCHMQAWQRIYRKMTWFTVFFIPVLPLWISRLTVCATCGAGSKIGKAEADALIAQAQSHSQHPAYGQHPTAHA